MAKTALKRLSHLGCCWSRLGSGRVSGPFWTRFSPASGTSIKFLGAPRRVESPARSGNCSGRGVGRGGRESLLLGRSCPQHPGSWDRRCPEALCRAERPQQGEHGQGSCFSAPSLRPSAAPGWRKSQQALCFLSPCSRPVLALTHAPAQAAVLPPPPFPSLLPPPCSVHT